MFGLLGGSSPLHGTQEDILNRLNTLEDIVQNLTLEIQELRSRVLSFGTDRKSEIENEETGKIGLDETGKVIVYPNLNDETHQLPIIISKDDERAKLDDTLLREIFKTKESKKTLISTADEWVMCSGISSANDIPTDQPEAKSTAELPKEVSRPASNEMVQGTSKNKSEHVQEDELPDLYDKTSKSVEADTMKALNQPLPERDNYTQKRMGAHVHEPVVTDALTKTQDVSEVKDTDSNNISGQTINFRRFSGLKIRPMTEYFENATGNEDVKENPFLRGRRLRKVGDLNVKTGQSQRYQSKSTIELNTAGVS